MRSRDFRSSRINRDHREASFARAVIAQAARLAAEQEARNTMIMMRAGEIEVCPDCLGSGEVVRQVADGRESEAICLECNGRGWIR